MTSPITTAPTTISFPAKVGVFWASDHWSARQTQEVARDIEQMGFGSLFFPESGGKDSVTLAATLLAATNRLVIGTGIINIFARHASIAEAGARTLDAAYPHRFILGLGVSHAIGLERRFGMKIPSPLTAMREYLDEMASLPPYVETQVGRPTRVLAALGPKMIALAAKAGDGVMPYLVTSEHTRVTRDLVGTGKWVITEQAVAFEGSESEWSARAAGHLDAYLRFENYRNSWLRQGFSEEDLVPGGSDRIRKALIGMGSVDAAVASVRAQLDAGADHVVIQVLGDGPLHDPRPSLAVLASALELESQGVSAR